MTGKPSDSTEQNNAEQHLLRALELYLSTEDTPIRFEQSNPKDWVLKLDGYCPEPLIFVEAWAHIGPAKGAQINKPIIDMSKMLMAEYYAGKPARKIFAVHCEDAVKFLKGKSWKQQFAEFAGVEIIILDIPDLIKQNVKEAQILQAEGMKKKQTGLLAS